MAEQARRALLSRLATQSQVCLYAIVGLGILGSILFFQLFGADSSKFWQMLGWKGDQVYSLPSHATSRDAYSADLIKQLGRIDELEEREPLVSYTQRILDFEQRVLLVDEVLSQELTPEDYHDVMVSKLSSLVNLVETRNLQSREKLVDSLKEYAGHPDTDVQRLMLMGQTALAFIDYLKTTYGELQPAMDCARNMLQNFSKSEAVAAFLDAEATVLVSRQRYEAAIALMQLMHQHFAQSSNLSIAALADTLHDRVFFAEIRYDQAVERMRNQKPGAQEVFLECLSKIAGNPKAGMLSFNELARAAYFYEQFGRVESARDVYGLLERKMAYCADSRIANLAKDTSVRGAARLNSIGKPILFIGTKPDGTVVSNENLLGRIVVLYFWRGTQTVESFQTAVELNDTMRHYKDTPVAFLGIGADTDSDEQAKITFNKIPSWQLKLEDHLTSVQKLESELGIPSGPYVTILDQSGKICAISVAPSQLKGWLDRLTSSPLSGHSNRPDGGRIGPGRR